MTRPSYFPLRMSSTMRSRMKSCEAAAADAGASFLSFLPLDSIHNLTTSGHFQLRGGRSCHVLRFLWPDVNSRQHPDAIQVVNEHGMANDRIRRAIAKVVVLSAAAIETGKPPRADDQQALLRTFCCANGDKLDAWIGDEPSNSRLIA